MSAHLLTLADLHAAAPGVLDVVFGPDGDFLLAPMFRPPLWHADGYWVWAYTVDDLVSLPVALDLRIPTVAARLAGLCAQTFGETGTGWRIDTFGDCWRLTNGRTCYKWPQDGSVYGTAFKAIPVVAGAPWDNAPSFLAALTLALATRIATLKDAK